MKFIYNSIIDNYTKLYQYVCQYATLKIQLNHFYQNKWYKDINIKSLDDLKSLFPHDFCSMPSLVHSCVDMFMSIHDCRYMLITQYFNGSFTNQEMGDQRIKKWWPFPQATPPPNSLQRSKFDILQDHLLFPSYDICHAWPRTAYLYIIRSTAHGDLARGSEAQYILQHSPR
jgi:hypothetical protein